MLLVLYVLWGIGLFRLLASHTDDRRASWPITSIALLSLPATAFSYQDYPEVAGGWLLVTIARYLTTSTDARVWTAFGYGLLAGFLPWLHVRFGYATVLSAIVLAATKFGRARSVVVGFWAGVTMPLAALSLYSYHITGSLLPFKVWSLMQAAEPTTQTYNPAFARRFVGLWLDTDWGLVAHAPV